MEHLVFLQFILQDGAQYLPWIRAKEIWETLISNPDACDKDKEVKILLKYFFVYEIVIRIKWYFSLTQAKTINC